MDSREEGNCLNSGRRVLCVGARNVSGLVEFRNLEYDGNYTHRSI